MDALRIDDNGDLILTVGDGEIAQRAPLAYQETDRSRTIVPAQYMVRSAHEVGIQFVAPTIEPVRWSSIRFSSIPPFLAAAARTRDLPLP